MKIISWNINGLKAILNKNFEKNVSQLVADFICVQETKFCKKQLEIRLDGYYKYFNFSQRSGYSGVGIFAKKEPINFLIGMEIEDEYGEIYQADNESRVITLEYDDFYLVSVYMPHSSKNERKIYRQEFDNNFIEYIEKLETRKNTIILGVISTINYTRIDIIGTNQERYSFYLGNEVYKDDKDNKIDKSDLKVGDTIHIVNKKGAVESIYPIRLPNVKSVQFLGRNLQTLSENLMLISLDNSEEYILSDLEWVSILNILDSINLNNDNISTDLSKENKYVPQGISNYQYKNKSDNITETVIEIYSNEIHIVRNDYLVYKQIVTKLNNERYNQLINLL